MNERTQSINRHGLFAPAIEADREARPGTGRLGLTRTPLAAMALAAAALLLLLTPAVPEVFGASGGSGGSASAELIPNGGFEKGLNDRGEPVAWHTRLTSIIPVPEYEDPENKTGRTGVTLFKCGCGHVWGDVRPWTNLVCPECGHMNVGLEDSGGWYQENHKHVKLGPGRRGKGVRLTLPKHVGEMQGVRVLSRLITAERGAGYEISFDALSKGPHLRVFVEGFRLVPQDRRAKEWLEQQPAEMNPMQIPVRLKRVYRKQINVGAPRQWERVEARFTAPRRYVFDYLMVNLYAYMPGEAAYDNVRLRQLTKRELARFLEDNPGPKDRRLR